MSDNVEKERLKLAAGLKYLPTDLTYKLRMAIGGHKKDEFLSWGYQWTDKPHRLVYAACSEAEAQADTITRLTAEVENQVQWVRDLADKLIAEEAKTAALTAEVERLRRCLAKDPKTILLAYEDGRHEQLARMVAQRDDKIETLTARVTELEAALKLRHDAEDECLRAVEYVGQYNSGDRVVEAKGRVRVAFAAFEEAERDCDDTALSHAQPAPTITQTDSAASFITIGQGQAAWSLEEGPWHPWITTLEAYQQADADGVMVLVSRQAVDEVVAFLKSIPLPPPPEKGGE